MYTGYAYIGQTDLTLLGTTDLHGGLLVWAQQMQISLFFLNFLLYTAVTLKYDIRFLWLIKCNHLDNFRILKFDIFRQQFLTNLALNLRKVISNSQSNNFLLNLNINPTLKTPHMNKLTSSLTFTWINQRIIFSKLLTKTNFT